MQCLNIDSRDSSTTENKLHTEKYSTFLKQINRSLYIVLSDNNTVEVKFIKVVLVC